MKAFKRVRLGIAVTLQGRHYNQKAAHRGVMLVLAKDKVKLVSIIFHESWDLTLIRSRIPLIYVVARSVFLLTSDFLS